MSQAGTWRGRDGDCGATFPSPGFSASLLTLSIISIFVEIWKRSDAVAALAALAQDNRLDVFRLLVQAGPEGLAAGAIAERLALAPNTLSFHFDRLRQAGLVTVKREGRSLIYAARFETMNDVARLPHRELLRRRSAAPARPLSASRKRRRAARKRRCPHDRRSHLQRAVPLHRQFRPLGAGGSDPQQDRRRKIQGLQRGLASEGTGASEHAAAAARHGLRHVALPLEIMERVRASPARRRSISSSPSATTPPAKPARSGPASR